MYHYTESGLQNVWLTNGYKTRQTEGGVAVAIVDAEGLHQAIGRHIAAKGRMTKEEFRFLRKELDLSQSRFAAWTGMSVDMVSKWGAPWPCPKNGVPLHSGNLSRKDGWQCEDDRNAGATGRP